MMSHIATITDVVEELKVEWQQAVERGEINDAMQVLIVQLLEEAVRNAVALRILQQEPRRCFWIW